MKVIWRAVENKGNKAERCLYEEVLEVRGSGVMRWSQGTQIPFQYFSSLAVCTAVRVSVVPTWNDWKHQFEI